jgi:hypothetical protein
MERFFKGEQINEEQDLGSKKEVCEGHGGLEIEVVNLTDVVGGED